MPACPNCGRDNSGEARFCQFCGTEIAGTAGPSEQRRIVTIVFSDVTGSTALGEQLDPEPLRRVMSRYFDGMKAVIERHGGTVEKFIGDAVMAVFGIPQLHEDDALRAVRAANEMQHTLDSLNRELDAEHGVTIQTRTGVNTGEVVASTDPAATERLVTGDAVNVAARLEQAAAPGEILIGSPTYDLVRDAVEVVPVEPLQLKGKSEPLPAYRLVEVRAGAVGRQRHMSSPMVGRDRQLRSLLDAFDNSVTDRSCHLFTVLGSAGVGKSRLVHEFRSRIDGRAVTHSGRCVSYGEGITFLPLEEIVRSATGIDEIDSTQDLTAGIRTVLAGSKDQDDVTSRLAGLLHASSETVSLQDGFWAARKLLEHMATEQPLVVTIDDIHWAEPALLDLIEHVADWSRDVPILFLCMARPELLDNRPNWGGGKLNATSILLEPLAAADSGELMRHLLGEAELPGEVQERITNASEGNPLFVEEMLGMLIDDGMLQRQGEQWVTAGDIAELSVPPSIQTLIAARLDRLDPDERTVIERGSVEGKLFHVGSVVALAPESDRQSVPSRLMSLVRKELIRPDRAEIVGDDAFRFRHLLIRDAAYDSMPKEMRAELHERFAEWLAGHVAQAPGGMDAILAYHLEQAYLYRVELGSEGERERGLADLAGSRYRTAGKAALGQGDYPGAIGLLERASELLGPRSDEGLEARLLLGRARFGMGQYPSADKIFRRIEADAQSLQNRLLELEAGVGLLQVRDHLDREWTDEQRIALSENLEKELTALGEVESAGRAALIRFMALPRKDRRAASERVAQMARQAGASHLESEADMYVLIAAFQGPTPAGEAILLARSMLERPVAALEYRAHFKAILAGLLEMNGRSEEGSAVAEQAGDEFRELGLRGQSSIAFNSGMVALMTGDLERADLLTRRGFDEQAALGEKNRLSSLAASLARITAIRDDVDEARHLMSISSEAASPDDIDTYGELAITRAILALKGGDPSGAIGHAREALSLSESLGIGWVRAGFMTVLADAFVANGERDAAVKTLNEALAIFESKEFVPAAERVRARLTELAGNP